MICFQTNLIKRSQNPRWNFERAFAYRASAESLRAQLVCVQVFHRSMLLGDVPIGAARVSLYDVATAPCLFDLPLLDAYGKPAGRISLNIKMQQRCALTVALPSLRVDLSRVRARTAARRARALLAWERMRTCGLLHARARPRIPIAPAPRAAAPP
jgi:hypothetical protein